MAASGEERVCGRNALTRDGRSQRLAGVRPFRPHIRSDSRSVIWSMIWPQRLPPHKTMSQSTNKATTPAARRIHPNQLVLVSQLTIALEGRRERTRESH